MSDRKDKEKGEKHEDGDTTNRCFFCQGEHRKQDCVWFTQYKRDNIDTYRAGQAAAVKARESEAKKGASALATIKAWSEIDSDSDDYMGNAQVFNSMIPYSARADLAAFHAMYPGQSADPEW